MNSALLELTERLVPISDFSQGKAGKIFTDVADNNHEYIVLKNNQPTAVIMSIREYKDVQQKISRLERYIEKIENIRLLRLAQSRTGDDSISFEDFVAEEGFDMDELMELSESVDLE